MPTLLNGKRTEKAKSKMVTEEKAKPSVEPRLEVEEGDNEDRESNEDQETKEPKLTLLKRLEPDMLTDPYPLEFPGVETSEEFCYDKCSRFILEPLGNAIAAEKDWLNFARNVWQWREQAEDRRLEAKALDAIARLEEDPRILKIVKQKLVER